MAPKTLETSESNPADESLTETSENKRERSLRIGIGAVLLALGTILLIPLSLLSGIVPGAVGSLATILLTGGTLLVGTSIHGRSV